MEVDLDEIADSLYGLAPEEFTKARDDAARDATDADLKKAVKALRRPTAAAHAVNRLTRDRTDDIDALVALGDDMRAAMGGDPQEVRRLTEQRRALIADLVDGDLPTAVQQDVTATLEAATADPELGAALRSGRLVKPLRYAGFGAMPDLDDAVATPLPAKSGVRRATRKQAVAPPAKKSTPKQPTPPPAKQTATKAEEAAPDLTAARERCLELSGLADDAQRRYELAVRAATEARSLLDRAEKERAEAHKAARAAHKDAEQARRELGRLERR